MSKEAEILLDKRTTAAALSISIRMLEKLVRRGDLFPIRVGDRVLFLRSEIERFVHVAATNRRGSRLTMELTMPASEGVGSREIADLTEQVKRLEQEIAAVRS